MKNVFCSAYCINNSNLFQNQYIWIGQVVQYEAVNNHCPCIVISMALLGNVLLTFHNSISFLLNLVYFLIYYQKQVEHIIVLLKVVRRVTKTSSESFEIKNKNILYLSPK